MVSPCAQKGGILMSSLSFIECCHLLAIDPKTLRQWLVQAQMSLHVHPTDARIKCLTGEQVNVLANLHDRVLLLSVEASDASPTPSGAQHQRLPDVDLRAKLVQMETQVATLQTQLTDLAFQLLQEREQHTEHRLMTLEAVLTLTGEHAGETRACSVLSVPELSAMAPLVCHPTEQRNRLIPLIEYGAKGSYVLICPEAGELHITPDSAEWFAWLASLSSCAFCRPGRPF
jgi:hypothetical protein